MTPARPSGVLTFVTATTPFLKTGSFDSLYERLSSRVYLSEILQETKKENSTLQATRDDRDQGGGIGICWFDDTN